MGKSKETFNKKEKEKKKLKKRQEKIEKKEERKANTSKGKSLDDMLAYVDENGNLTSTPPDQQKRRVIRQEDIVIGVPRAIEGEDGDTENTGIVTFFNTAKGYGFIKDKNTNQSVFVHANDLEEPIKENDKVVFEVERGPKGLNARNVKLMN